MGRSLLKILLLILCLPAAAPHSHAQTKEDSTIKRHGFLDVFSIGLPIVNAFNYTQPIKSKKLLSQPYGLNTLLYDQQPSFGVIFPFSIAGSFRILSLCYKEKIGLELYYSSYGAYVDSKGMSDYLAAYFAAKYPNHYFHRLDQLYSIYSFQGAMWGLTYKMHYKKWIAEPKFLLGFESASPGFPPVYILKEMGGNQFINYTITEDFITKHQNSYHFQMNFARRFRFNKRSNFKHEIGINSEFMFAPYTAKFTLTEQAYGMAPVSHFVTFNDVFKTYSFGLFYAIYLAKDRY